MQDRGGPRAPAVPELRFFSRIPYGGRRGLRDVQHAAMRWLRDRHVVVCYRASTSVPRPGRSACSRRRGRRDLGRAGQRLALTGG